MRVVLTFLVFASTSMLKGNSQQTACIMAPNFETWYKYNYNYFKEGDPFFIEEIPNKLCALATEADTIGCKSCSSKLQQWYFPYKCMQKCHAYNCAPYTELMVECQFSARNLLDQPIGDTRWSAECDCPANTVHAGEKLKIPDTTYTEMLDEWNANMCSDKDAVGCEGTIDCDPYACTNSDISWCDQRATCTTDYTNPHGYNCTCNVGFTGSGYDCVLIA